MKVSIVTALIFAVMIAVLAGCNNNGPVLDQPAPNTKAPASAIAKPQTMK